MKRSRREKSPWIKSKTKPVANKKKIDEFHLDRRQNLAKSDKGSYFNQLSESEAACASSLDVSAASKKKHGSEESRRKQCYERATFKNKPGLFLLNRRIFHFPKRVLLKTTLAPSLFLFCVSFVPFVLSFVDHG